MPNFKNKYKKHAKRFDGTGSLLAVDPGAHKIGLALFNSAGQLVAAGTVDSIVDEKAVEAVLQWLGGRSPSLKVCELPRKRPGKRRYHKDIDRLLLFLRSCPWRWDARFYPEEWKSSMPKGAHHKRIHAALTPAELEVMPPLGSGHDTWDAVGIGLFALGRTDKGGNAP